MPVSGARAVHLDPAAQAGPVKLVAQYHFGHRRPADIAQADQAGPVHPERMTRRRCRQIGATVRCATVSRHATSMPDAATRPASEPLLLTCAQASAAPRPLRGRAPPRAPPTT